jgi:hypothetical protein
LASTTLQGCLHAVVGSISSKEWRMAIPKAYERRSGLQGEVYELFLETRQGNSKSAFGMGFKRVDGRVVIDKIAITQQRLRGNFVVIRRIKGLPRMAILALLRGFSWF